MSFRPCAGIPMSAYQIGIAESRLSGTMTDKLLRQPLLIDMMKLTRSKIDYMLAGEV